MSLLAEKMVLASFAADSLAGGRLSLQGTQMFILLENLTSEGGWTAKGYHLDWQAGMKHYSGITDGATKSALAAGAEGGLPGSGAGLQEDISPLSRIAPLLWFYRDDPEDLNHVLGEYVAMTHRAPVIHDAARIFARTAFDMLMGEELIPALRTLCEHHSSTKASALILEGLEAVSLSPPEALGRFGPSGTADQALPLTAYILGKFADDPIEGHKFSLQAGGDVTCRSGILGMLFGAHLGLGSLEPGWILATEHLERIQDLLDWDENLEDLLRP